MSDQRIIKETSRIDLGHVRNKSHKFNNMMKIEIFLLIIYITNIRNFGVYLPIFMIPIFFIYILKKKENVVFWQFISLLFSFGFSYGIISLFYGYSSKGDFLFYTIYPIMFYSLAYKSFRDLNYKKAYITLLVISFSLSMLAFISIIRTRLLFGGIDAAFFTMQGRYVINVVTSQKISGTVINLYLSFGLSLLPILLIKGSKTEKRLKFYLLISFIVSLYSIIMIGNRTGLLIIIVSITANFFIINKSFFENCNKILKLSVWVIPIIMVYFYNFFNIQDILKGSHLLYRFSSMSGSSDPRVYAWIEAFKGLFIHPIGGKMSNLGLGYAHNMWLDVGYETGIFPFLLILMFTLLSLVQLHKFIKYSHPVLLKVILLSFYVAIFTSFAMEPVIKSWFTYFVIFCYLTGIVTKLNLLIKVKVQN